MLFPRATTIPLPTKEPTMNTRVRKALAGSALAASILGTGGYAFAQTSTTEAPAAATETAPADATPAPDTTERGPRGPRGGSNHAERTAALAEKLGMTAEQVTAARDAARAAVDAQLGTPQKPSERPTTAPTDEERAAHEAEHQARHDAMRQAFATELGISVEQLQAAHEAIAEDRLAAQVAAGEITQEQADEKLARIQSGEVDHRGPGGHGKGPRGGQPPADAATPAS